MSAIQTTQVAASIPFDNATNGFTATDVQAALEEIHNQTPVSTEVSATADATTTSTTDVLMTSMTITPTSGKYFVSFSGCVDHSAQSVAVVGSIYSGGSRKADSERSIVPRFNGIGANSLSPCMAINGVVTVNGSQAIEIRWKTASGTATVHTRTLDILRVV